MSLCAVAVLAAGCGKATPRPSQAPTQEDRWASSLAVSSGDARLCEEISPMAHQTVPWNPPGRRSVWQRAWCFYAVAVNTGDARLCERVDPSEGQISAGACREEVSVGPGPRYSGVALGAEEVEELLRRAGKGKAPKEYVDDARGDMAQARLSFLAELIRDEAFRDEVLEVLREARPEGAPGR